MKIVLLGRRLTVATRMVIAILLPLMLACNRQEAEPQKPSITPEIQSLMDKYGLVVFEGDANPATVIKFKTIHEADDYIKGFNEAVRNAPLTIKPRFPMLGRSAREVTDTYMEEFSVNLSTPVVIYGTVTASNSSLRITQQYSRKHRVL